MTVEHHTDNEAPAHSRPATGERAVCTQEVAPQAAGAIQPYRILVVDDDEADRDFLCELLADHRDIFDIRCAGDGQRALKICESERVHCILLDYWLECEHGDDLIPLFLAANPHCPVLMLTGQGSEKVAMASFKRGAADYIRKSELSADALAVKLKNAIGQAEQARIHAERHMEFERLNRLDALGELCAGLSHDFNNLLATAQYAIALARRDVPHGKARRHLSDALAVIEKGADLTNRLKAFAYGGNAQEVVSRPVGEVLDDLVQLVGNTLGSQISVETVAEQPQLKVCCDQTQLIQALVNLALNARDAILQGGVGSKLRISVGRCRSQLDGASRPLLSFAVSDDGPGMTREVQSRATDPYFTTKERAPGRGLGLSMVYGFVQQSHGEFSIETEHGKGTTVTMALPQDRASATLAEQRDRQPCRIAPASRRQRILMVDDELLLLAEAAEIVRDFGYDVQEASSGAEALTMIDPNDPVDLLLTDVQMPRMNGFLLAKAARERVPDLKVLYFSGYTGYSQADMGDVIAPIVTKPCAPEELRTRIMAILAESDPPLPEAATIAGPTRPPAGLSKPLN